MKLSEIEGVKEVNTWIGGLPYRVEPVDKLHTPEQMQEYAKECVREALKFLDNKILPIFEDDERVVMQKIFEEDTKND